MTRHFSIYLVPALTLSLLGAPSPARAAISMQLKDNRILMPCQLNDFATTCILDTGSSRTILPVLPWVLELPSSGLVTGTSVKGKMICDLVKVDIVLNQTLQVSDQTLRRCPGVYGDFANGTVGMDQAGKFAFKFDFAHDQFALTKSGPGRANKANDKNRLETSPKNATATKSKSPSTPGKAEAPEFDLDIFPTYGQMLVPGLFAGEDVQVLWDTGIPSDGWIDTAFIQSHSEFFEEVEQTTVMDIAGGVMKTRIYKTSALTIGGRPFPLTVEAIDFSNIPLDRHQVPIFLGLSAIQKANWKMDPVRRKWSFF